MEVENVEVYHNEISDMKNIKRIGKSTVHKIFTGQVVISLAIAVKELIENSIDAGATKIDIELNDYGTTTLTVSDNGCGVSKENFSVLTQEHCTSKLREFDDLEHISTLGFRGQALSALCNVSDLTIITRHRTVEYATKVVYDHNGEIIDEQPTARSIGTTVTLSNLFHTLPVRRKDFLRNSKREFNKMCNLLMAYCLVSTSVKFYCTNKTPSGSKSTIISTQANKCIKDNIISIFGSKQISSLIEINLKEPSQDILEEYGLGSDNMDVSNDPLFEWDFIISSAVTGSGRSVTDRQYFFINSRPCEMPLVAKLCNKIYKQHNQSNNQFPFIYLNVKTSKKSLVDINVTPDKRKIFMVQEKLLMATIKTSLLNAFKDFPSTYQLRDSTFDCKSTQNLSTELKPLKRCGTDILSNLLESNRHACKKLKTEDLDEDMEIESSDSNTFKKQLSILDIASFKNIKKENSKNIVEDKLQENPSSKSKVFGEKEKILNKSTKVSIENDKTAEPIEAYDNMAIESQQYKKFRQYDNLKVALNDSCTIIQKQHNKLKNKLNKDELCTKFKTKICPKDNEKAVNELTKQVTKEMFAKMEIIGQFNYAFIVTKSENDLFIIDQHASDEKYNFERLQATTMIENQILVRPKSLELTAAQESLLIEHESTFNKNGFYFIIDEDAEATKKVKLTKIPVSKNYLFGKDDIDEMIFMLEEGCNQSDCRPSRLRGMFASRACRKSVMVGKALTTSDMRTLVNHMCDIEHPWNCPHGRPTMRHLVNLDLLNID